MKKIKKRLLKKNKRFKLALIIPTFLVAVTLVGLLWYKNNVVTPSINLADGLDAEEAAFLQKSISKDKVKSVGTAPAPVVKVTVKKKNGDEVTGKVVLQNIDPTSDVTTLTTSITNTVTTNNAPSSTSPLVSPMASSGLSCGTTASSQWAQTGIRYQSDGATACTSTSTSTSTCSDKKECVQCINGILDLTNKQVCGSGMAINYITTPSDKDQPASCWNNGVWYANSTSLANIGYCQNGKWITTPPISTIEPIVIDTRIEQEELDKQKLDEQKLAEPNISSITTNQAEIAKETARITKLYADKSCGGSSVLKSNEQCVMIQGTAQYGIVPKDFAGSISYNSGATAGRPESMTNNSYQDAKTCELAKRSGETCEPNTIGGFTIVRDATPNPYIEYEFGSQSQTPTPTSTTTIPNMEYGEEPVEESQAIDPTRDLVYYSQRDKQWSDAEFTCPNGVKVSFAQAGCGETAAAMLLSTYIDPKYTPKFVKDEYYNDATYCSGSGSSTGIDVLEDNGFIAVRNPDPSNLPALLEEGNVLWAGVQFRVDGETVTHHTIITGYDVDGKPIFQDPWFGPDVDISDFEEYDLIGYTLLIPPGNDL